MAADRFREVVSRAMEMADPRLAVGRERLAVRRHPSKIV